jgi:hypothetical protein
MTRFVDVLVEEHEDLPDGCCLRFRAQSDPFEIGRVAWEAESGTAGLWQVEGRTKAGEKTAALAYRVDDSSAGTSILVVGGSYGLRLTSLETSEVVAEAYLLVSPTAVTT